MYATESAEAENNINYFKRVAEYFAALSRHTVFVHCDIGEVMDELELAALASNMDDFKNIVEIL